MGNTRHSCARGKRSILIPTMRRNEISEEIHSPNRSPTLLVPSLPHFLPSSSLPRSRRPSPRKCACDNRRTRFHRYSTSSPCSLSFSYLTIPYRPFISARLVYAEKYLPFSNNTGGSSSIPAGARNGARGS